MKWQIPGIISIFALIAAVFLLVEREPAPTEAPAAPKKRLFSRQEIPDFAAFNDVKLKKRSFFEFMLPMVREANAAVLEERELVMAIRKKLDKKQNLSNKDINQLNALIKKYKVNAAEKPTADDITQLLRRVDVVPASLILAQAANESAWGTSRFALQAYNFFGIWCFEPGCGLTPRLRDDGLTHEVAKFETVQHGVEYYLLTINTNRAYRDLRRIRAQLRAENNRISGIELSKGLVRYSERGMDYVREIQAMIRINSLQSYTLDTTQVSAGN